MKQRITIFLNNGEQIEKISEYNSEYQLDKDIISLGVNGVIRKIENDITEYFPPHTIMKIEVKKI